MKCSKCGSELNQGAKFCSSCGAKVENPVAYCSNCGTKLDPTAKFCPECGTKVGTQETAPVSEEEKLPAVQEKEVSDKWIFVNIADEGLFGTCGYWKNGKVKEFRHKKYKDTHDIEAVLKDAKAEAEKVLGEKIGRVVIGIPDVISYADLCRYRKAAEDAGYVSYRFIRTSVAQGLAISKELVFDEKNDDGLNFGIYNYVDGNLIGTVIEAADGVVEVKYVAFNNRNTMAGDKSRIKTFCKKCSSYTDNWNYVNCRDEKASDQEKEFKRCQDYTKTIILNENCGDLKSFLINEDGADKQYMEIKKGYITNKGLALQAALLSKQIEDLLLLDTTPFFIEVKLNDPQNYGGYDSKTARSWKYDLTGSVPMDFTIPTKKGIGMVKRFEQDSGEDLIPDEEVTFATWKDNQSSIDFEIRIFNDYTREGENMSVVPVSYETIPFRIDGIPPAPAGKPKIEFTIDIDANMAIYLRAKVVGFGIVKKLQL